MINIDLTPTSPQFKIEEKRWEEALQRKFIILDAYLMPRTFPGERLHNLDNLKKSDLIDIFVMKRCNCNWGEIEHKTCLNCEAQLPKNNVIRIPCPENCDRGLIFLKQVTIALNGITEPYEAGICSGYRIASFDPPIQLDSELNYGDFVKKESLKN